MATVKLLTRDREIIVEYEIIKCSKLIQNAVKSIGDTKDEVIVELKDIESSTIERIIKWTSYHINEEIDPDKYSHKRELKEALKDICEFDEKFLKMDQSSLLAILKAVHHLDIQELLNLLMLHTAGLISGKTAPELRTMFGIQENSDYSEEE